MAYIKVVQSGDLVEVYQYEREPNPARLVLKKPRKTRYGSIGGLRRVDNSGRTKLAFRRLIRANLQKGAPCMLTLTMLNILAYEDAVRCYTAFGRSLRGVFGRDIAWIAVPEFQRRGALHFHVLIWGFPYDVIHSERLTRRIQNIWGYGYVDIIATDGSPKLASYLGKYMSKAMQDLRTNGKRAYFPSRNLVRPVSVSSPSQVDLLLEVTGVRDLPTVRDLVYDTKWLGRASYKSYSLYQHGQKSDFVDC